MKCTLLMRPQDIVIADRNADEAGARTAGGTLMSCPVPHGRILPSDHDVVHDMKGFPVTCRKQAEEAKPVMSIVSMLRIHPNRHTGNV